MNRYPDQSPGVETPLAPGDASPPLRRDAVENRERILDAARRLFTESGIEAVSMHRIAQGAGVGQATLYRHYIHKGELCRDLMTDTMERARASSRRIGEKARAAGARSPGWRDHSFRVVYGREVAVPCRHR